MKSFLLEADKTSAAQPHQGDGPPLAPLALAAIIILIALAAYFLIKYFRSSTAKAPGKAPMPTKRPTPENGEAPVVSFTENTSAKPKAGLTLDSLNNTPTKVSASSTPSPTAPMPDSPPPPPTPSSTPTVSVGPGDFEKALAHAGQRMDAMLVQSTELTRQLKLSEKAKTEATIALNQATESLTKQLEYKDAELSKLSALVEQKSSYPSLRALIEVKKLCQDMLGTQKPLSHDDLIKFIADDIDNKLSGLDVQSVEFAPGTPLEKIPGEQVENSPRSEPTQDPTQVNQVARLLRPCYYIERDSKRIIIAKASVVLYRLTPVTPTPTSSTPPPA